MPRSSGKRRHPFLWGFGILFLIIIALYTRFRINVNNDYDRDLAAARKAGLWTEIADFKVTPPIPEAENAGPRITALEKSLGGNATPTEKVTQAAINSPADEAAFNEACRTAEPFIAEFRSIAKLRKCDFQRNWAAGSELAFPEFTHFRWIIRIACMQARLKANHGDPIGGLNLLAQYAPLAHLAGSDPILISKLVQIAQDSIIFREIETILGSHGREPGVPEAAQKVVAALGPPPDLSQSIKGECGLGLVMIESLEHSSQPMETNQDGTVSPSMRAFSLLSHDPGVRKLWATRHLMYYQRLLAATLNNSQYKARNQAVVSADAPSDSFSVASLWSAFMEPVYLQSFVVTSKDLSNRRIAAQLIASLQAWNRTGQKPTKLALTGSDAIDPISGQSLHFAATPDGFKIWGNATDGKDHGGNLPDSKTEPIHLDILMSYPYTPPKRAPLPR